MHVVLICVSLCLICSQQLSAKEILIDNRRYEENYSIKTMLQDHPKPVTTVMQLRRKEGMNGNLPIWKVVDSVREKAGENLYPIGYGRCGYEGRSEEDVVVLMDVKTERIIGAWRVDLKAEKFQPLEAGKIKCAPQCPDGCQN